MTFLDYAPAPESTALLNLRDSYGLFIDGEFVDGRGDGFVTISRRPSGPSPRSRAPTPPTSTPPWPRPDAPMTAPGPR